MFHYPDLQGSWYTVKVKVSTDSFNHWPNLIIVQTQYRHTPLPVSSVG